MKARTDTVVAQLTESRRERWNAFVAREPSFAMLQSWEWGEYKEKLGWKAFRIAVAREGRIVAGAQMLIKSPPLRLPSVSYVPRGPVGDWLNKEIMPQLLSELHRVARQHSAIFLRIEPPKLCAAETESILQAHGFIPNQYSNQPQCTMIIDLNPDIDTIFDNMDKRTRYNIRFSARKGVQVREGSERDLPTVYQLMRATAKRAEFSLRSFDYYRQQWKTLAPRGLIKLFIATYEDKAIAFRIAAVFGGRAATLHSGSLNPHHKWKPNELLMWKCIKWAKEQRCTSYDVWGVAEEVGELTKQGKPIPKNQKGGMWGVYYFKRGFGGKVISYVGAYDFVHSTMLYRLVNMILTRSDWLHTLPKLGDMLYV